MWQVANEADGINENRLAIVRQCQFSHGRIQRREQLVLYINTGIGQRIEQSRLAGIGVADYCDGRDLCTNAILPVHCTAAADLVETCS